MKGVRPETWAFGFRNPWRMTVDEKTGRIWVGQNGQDLWEQAFLVHKGDNYGWSVTEGSHPFYRNRKAGPDAVRQADDRASSFRISLAHRRHRLLRQKIPRTAGRLHLRRLLHRQDLGHAARRHEADLAQGTGRFATCKSPDSASIDRANCSSPTTAARARAAFTPSSRRRRICRHRSSRANSATAACSTRSRTSA